MKLPNIQLAFACLAAAAVALAADWPQLQCDAAHTGYTPDQPSHPFSVKWVRDLDQPTQASLQPIVADGKVFVGTGRGNLLALDRVTGKTLWTHKTGAPILASAAWHRGLVLVTSMDHCCHAVRSADGTPVWTFETGEGIWAAPVVADGRVFVAGRDGFVYALDPATGKELWRAEVGGLVLTTPACADGRLYVGAGDMHVYAFDARTGKEVWKSERLPAAAMREYWLVAAHGTVVATTQPAFASHTIQGFIMKGVMNPFNERTKGDPVLVEDAVFPELVKWFQAHPSHKSWHVLDAKTGREKFIAPVIGVNGGSCTAPPPAVAPDGFAYTVYANVWLTASGWAFFGRVNLATGQLEPLIRDRYAPKLAHPKQWHWQPKAGTAFDRSSTWNGGFSVIDQSWGVSIGGDLAFPVRDPAWPGNPPFNNTFNIRTREDRYLIPDLGRRRGLGRHGTFGAGFHNTCSAVAISGKQLFHKTPRSVLVAFEGK